ncbi:uncharacterized protein PAC_10988 [Phialocephala subalpina]|uniref:YDG domain-containing protein n=1 Tax=Phialocephala subalpina TaxID=576137 RepID=A0A1L7X7U6_9HELO|nr:uncharacterized protein PAC_10988 [Phialocephala subalpina]
MSPEPWDFQIQRTYPRSRDSAISLTDRLSPFAYLTALHLPVPPFTSTSHKFGPTSAPLHPVPRYLHCPSRHRYDPPKMSGAMDKIPDGYDLEEAVRALVPEHIRAKEIEPGNARMVQLKESIKKPLIAIKKVGWEHSSIETSQREGILELIWLYWNTEKVDIKFKSSPVCAEAILELLANSKSRLPLEIQQIGTIMLDLHQSNNWGIPPKVEERAESSTKSRKRPRSEKSEKKVDGEVPQAVYTRAPTTHPIFGTIGIMHHIQKSKGGQTTSYRVDPEYTKKGFNIFGHNSLLVGDVCHESKVLGSRIGGISGNIADGVYSIVVTGTYADIDIDSGDVIYYSVPGAIDTEDKMADREKDGPKKLLRSLATKKPVRVIRKHDSKWEGAPRAGLRYDGLYRVTGVEERSNDSGGKFLRFKLRRCSNQAPIDKSRPTRQERRAFADVQLGY